MKIAFIGFGEAARAFRESLAVEEPDLRFAAYDILLDRQGFDGACATKMREQGVEIAGSVKEAVSGADWIFSAVTADQSLEAANSIAPHLRGNQFLFDINSVSAECKRSSSHLLSPTRGGYVDMAVMAPVHPRGHRTPVLIAGPVDAALEQLEGLGFSFEIVGSQAGAATAIKMVRSLFVKGFEAITVETMLAADASGCLDYILQSLGSSYPGLGLPDLVNYQFERTLKHGKRRAAEMRESAATLHALGLHGQLAAAIADVQHKMGAIEKEIDCGQGVHRMVAEALAARRG